MAISRHIWLCMVMYGYLRLCIGKCGYVVLCSVMYGYIGLFMAM